MRNHLKYVLTLAALLPQIAFAAASLVRVDIAQPSRAYFYFNQQIPKHSTKLTEDKKNVKLTFLAGQIADSARSKRGDGVISNVYAQLLKKRIECDVILKAPMGYSTLSLPWSRAVVLDVFEWNKLSESDDAYRTALLALEEDLPEAAKPDLLKAASGGSAEAAFVLATLALMEGKANSALEALKYAERGGVSFPDLAAAKAQAYQLLGQPDSASRYSGLFISMSRGLPFLPIATAPLSERPGEISIPTNAWAAISAPADSATAKKPDTSAATQFPGLFADTAAPAVERYEAPSLFDRFPLWLQATLALSLTTFLLILWRYFKWRNAQLAIKIAENKKLNDIRIKEERAGAAEGNRKAVEAYKNKGKIIDKAIKEEAGLKKTAASAGAIERSELENLIRLYGGGAGLAGGGTAPKKQVDDAPQKAGAGMPSATPERINPKTELAQRLALEQQKLKNRKLTELAKSDLPGDENKRRNMAKEMGLELSSVEIKNALDKISDDKDRLAKLAQKFKNK
ncbi:MAG: hypothetical protein ACM3U1_04775 [Chloroflexota bacterium]